MGLFDSFKRKKKSEYEEEKTRVLPVIAFSSQEEVSKKENKEENKGPMLDEYFWLVSNLQRVWLKKYNKRKAYNYEQGIVEELYDIGLFSTRDLHRMLEADKEETQKLISFYTEHEPAEENIDFFEEFAVRHKLYYRTEVTDQTYNTLCSYISSCYDEHPSGRVLSGELTRYSLAYDQY